MIDIAGGTARLWPHIKTHKMAEVVQMQIEAGIDRFKCATIAEAEMAAKAGAKTVGLGPRILRCETAPLAVLSAVMTDGESGVINNKRLLHRILCNSLLLFCVILRFVNLSQAFSPASGWHRCPAEPVLP